MLSFDRDESWDLASVEVEIDAARSADDVLTMLMGDQAEPRREFIEKNALEVANLDVWAATGSEWFGSESPEDFVSDLNLKPLN